MKLRDIFKHRNTNVFIVTEQDDDKELNWTVEPTDFELIPEEENYYIVKAYKVSQNGKTDCYIGVEQTRKNNPKTLRINTN
ncbi:MAG TPA: hypothetical protein PKD18_05690 [Saprospiraceae bacterium]|nr:hypothetical protein [Saprospiraceae bacterium]